jgi:UDP-glucose 4-epimerase
MVIRDVARSNTLSHTSLRYFNVIGTRLPGVWDVSTQNIVPSVHDALLAGQAPRINGDDYDTPDGTCVRDYIDVGELADAHVSAATRALDGSPLQPAYNLGSEKGDSVKNIIDTSLLVTGIDVRADIGPRRPGDPASIIATSSLAASDLGWAPTTTLHDMVAADWAERSAHDKKSPGTHNTGN